MNYNFKIPQGRLADDDAALRQKREELKRKLLEGKKVPISPTGNVTGPESQTTITIPKGKLAASLSQWYEKDPGLLEAEKAAMHHAFPNFVLDKLEDGRLCWIGSLNVGIMGNNEWNIMAVYDNNHPVQKMGSSVKIYLVEPDIDELIRDLGWRPYHLLYDSNNQQYLCTASRSHRIYKHRCRQSVCRPHSAFCRRTNILCFFCHLFLPLHYLNYK